MTELMEVQEVCVVTNIWMYLKIDCYILKYGTLEHHIVAWTARRSKDFDSHYSRVIVDNIYILPRMYILGNIHILQDVLGGTHIPPGCRYN